MGPWRQDPDARIGDVEIAVELVERRLGQVRADGRCLDQDGDVVVELEGVLEGVIDLLAVLYADIGNEFGHHRVEVEHVVAQRPEHGHDASVLGRFLSLS